MKKLHLSILAFSISILTWGQESPITTCVFLVSKNEKLTQVFPNNKFPSKLAFGEGDIVEINPKNNQRFVDENGSELFFDSKTPGIFMNSEGELVKPCNEEVKKPRNIKNNNSPGNASFTNENTTANLKNKDRKVIFIGIVDIPTNKPTISVECIRIRREIEYRVRLAGTRATVLDVLDKSDLNSGAGLVLTKAKTLGDQLIALSKQCVGANQPIFCTSLGDFESSQLAGELIGIELKKIPGFESLDDSDIVFSRSLSNIK